MSLRTLRTAAALLVLASPACVLRLSDRNAPLENGGVSGPNADCSVEQPPPVGAPGTGAAATKFVGRYDVLTDPNRPRFDWSGNYMTARFEGTEVTWGAETGVEQVFEVIIDGRAQQVILPDYSTASAPVTTRTHKLPSGTHEITVMRSSEALFGATMFIPFTFGDGKQLPATEYARHIEYIGDSITCGYGDEGPNATCPYDVPIRKVKGANGELVDVKIPETQNIYLAYGSIAARMLGAEATTVCFSGKGVALNYREQGVGEGAILNPNDKPDPDAKTTIPEYYLRTLATEAPDPAKPARTWDFTKDPQPQVVVINIGQNDFSRDVNQDSIADGIDLGAFRRAYKSFVDFVRKTRPKAKIFLTVPPMVTDKFPLDNARTDFRATLSSITSELNGAGDSNVYFLELVEMGVRYGLGCDYHPNLEVHRIMAAQVAGAIRAKTCWSTVSE
jgi:lysophospholipase L1-like esterase